MARTHALLDPVARVSLDDYVRDLAWSPDGRGIAVAGGEGKVFLLDAAADALGAREVGAHGTGTLAVAWAPRGGGFATSGQDGALALWDAASGAERRRWQPARAWTEQLAWSPDASLLASAAGRAVALWTAAGEPVHAIPDHPSTVAALAWDRTGRDLAAAVNGGLRVHRIVRARAGGAPEVTTRNYPVQGAALTAAWSPNARVLATGLQAGAVHFWYLGSGKSSQMSGYGARVGFTEWSANSRYLATSSGAEIILWDFGGKGPEGTRPAELGGHTERVQSLAWQPAGPHLASGGRDWRISLWLPGRATAAIDVHLAGGEVTVVRWSPDGRRLAVGEATGTVAVYALLELP